MTNQTIILVDDNDKKLGYIDKDKAHTVYFENNQPKLGHHHRAVTDLIYNGSGEILVQERKHKIFNRLRDVTSSTHPLVKDGKEESYIEAGKRCLLDEWEGLENVELQVTSIFVNYSSRDGNSMNCENELDRLLIGKYDGLLENVRHNPEYAYTHTWIKYNVLVDDIKLHPQNYPKWVIELINKIEKEKPKELPFVRIS